MLSPNAFYPLPSKSFMNQMQGEHVNSIQIYVNSIQIYVNYAEISSGLSPLLAKISRRLAKADVRGGQTWHGCLLGTVAFKSALLFCSVVDVFTLIVVCKCFIVVYYWIELDLINCRIVGVRR